MFDIFDYLHHIEQRLRITDKRRRLVFAIWCCQPLVDEFGEYLGQKIGVNNLISIQIFLQNAWDYIMIGKPVSQEHLREIQTLSLKATWEENEDGTETEEEQLADSSAMEILASLALLCEVIESDSEHAAANTAEKIINRIDFELGMISGVDDIFSHPMMKEELARQEKMLEFLERGYPIENDTRRLYRE